jgi:hypothetical protein
MTTDEANLLGWKRKNNFLHLTSEIFSIFIINQFEALVILRVIKIILSLNTNIRSKHCYAES